MTALACRQAKSGWVLLALGAALAASGCADRLPAQMMIAGVQPQSGRVGAPVQLQVQGRFPVRTVADIGGNAKSSVSATYRARLGDLELEEVRLSSSGALLAVVPATLAAGVYDLTVIDPFGREQILPGAYRATLPVAALAFTSVPQRLGPGACSSPLVLELRNELNVASTIDVELIVSFAAAPGAGFGFFSDPGCTQALSQLAVPAGQATAQLFFSGQVPGETTVTASAPGLAPAIQLEAVTEAPDRLAFGTAPQTIPVGLCSGAATVELRGGSGTKVASVGQTQVALSVAGPTGLTFFADVGCTTPATGVTLTAGASSVDFYFLGAAAGTPEITAAAIGLANATQLETLTAGPGARLAFATPARTFIAGSCPGLARFISVRLLDALGNPTNAGPGGQALTAGSTSSGTVTWYDDSSCLSVAPGGSFTIPAGASTVDLFYRDTRAGSPAVSLANASGLANPTLQPQTVVAALPSVLAFTTPSRTLDALACSSVASTVETRDGFGNPASPSANLSVALAPSPAGLDAGLFDTAACGAGVAGVTVAAGTSQGSFFFRADNPGTLTIAASAGGFTGASQNHLINPAQPTLLQLSTPASPVEAGACAPVRVTRQDALGRGATPLSSTAVSVAAVPAIGLQFFSDSACTLPIFGVSIGGGAAFNNFFVAGTTGGSYTLTASSPGLSDGVAGLAVLPMVRRGTCAIASGTATVTCPVSPGLPANDIGRTLLLFAAANAANTPSEANVRCRLTTGASVNVVCDRVGVGASAVPVSWQTVSFARPFAAGGVSVQRLSGLFAGGVTASPIAVPVASVDLTRSFVLFSSNTYGVNNLANDFFTAKLTSATNVEIAQTGATFTTSGAWALQVVSFAGSNVLRGTTSTGANVAAVAVSALAAADTTRTFTLLTVRDSALNDTEDICKRKLRGVVSTATTLAFTRGNTALGACIDAPIAELAWERVELPPGARVQAVTVTHPNNAATGSAPIAVAVDLTRTAVFMAGQGQGGQAGGESDFGGLGNDILGALIGTASLAGTTVTVTRPASNLGSATFTPFVVQFVP